MRIMLNLVTEDHEKGNNGSTTEKKLNLDVLLNPFLNSIGLITNITNK